MTRKLVRDFVTHGLWRVNKSKDALARRIEPVGSVRSVPRTHGRIPRAQRNRRAAVLQYREVVEVSVHMRKQRMKLLLGDVEVVRHVLVLVPFELLVVQLSVEAHAAFHRAVNQLVVVESLAGRDLLDTGKRVFHRNRIIVEEPEDVFHDLRLHGIPEPCPNRAVFDAANHCLRHAEVEATIHAHGHDLASVERRGARVIGEGEILLRVRTRVVRSVRYVFVDIRIVLIRYLVRAIQVVHAHGHAILIRCEEQVHMPVIELHRVVVARQYLEVSHHGRAVLIVTDLHLKGLLPVADGCRARPQRIEVARLVYPCDARIA